MEALTIADIAQARDRIAGRVRPLAVIEAGPRADGTPLTSAGSVSFALEFLQYSGSFKVRGAQNFLLTHLERGSLPDVGVTIASGGNAGLACAWAARQAGVAATIFLPATAPPAKVHRLAAMGVQVRQVGHDYATAKQACDEFATATGAVKSHAYDNRLIAAGAGTVVEEILSKQPDIDTIVVAVGGGGLFTGVATAAHHYGVRTVAVEPEGCCCLHAALAAGEPVDAATDSIAADALGARRTSWLAFNAATAYDADSVLVSDEEIVAARRLLWDDYRLVVEHGAATALAGVLHGPPELVAGRRVAVVLCGANTDPTTL